MKHFIFNGRFGDIIHGLPATDIGEKVRMTVAHGYHTLLEGCSWIEGYGAPFPWDRTRAIADWAKAKFPGDEFIVMACYGSDYSPPYKSWSFLRESWWLSRSLHRPETVQLRFDQRSPAREQTLIQSLNLPKDKPLILLSAKGNSSPFRHANLLIEDIRTVRPEAHIVDLGDITAERVYDLLGLFERAAMLVTIDTMHLHLARAVPRLPIHALITDGPRRWNRTDWNPQQFYRDTYTGYLNNRQAFRQSLKGQSNVPTIQHVWSVPPTRNRRMDVAQRSWTEEFKWAGNWSVRGVKDEELPRLFKEDDNLPFIKDLLDIAAKDCLDDTDIVSYSNSDVGVVPGFTGMVIDYVRENGCAFTYRRDSYKPIEHHVLYEGELEGWARHGGSDWFICTKRWWREHRNEMPDMVIARGQWDCIMRQLMKKHGGREIPCAIWHEHHDSKWERPGVKDTLAGNRHNDVHAQAWYKMHNSDDSDPLRTTWNRQPGTMRAAQEGASGVHSPPITNPGIVLPVRFQFSRFNPRHR